VDDFGVLPAEVVVDVLLFLRGVLQVDPADDVGYPGEVVVDARLEIQHRPAAVLARFLARVGRVDHPEGDEVPDRRVLVVDVSLYPQHCLARGVLAVDHGFELREALLRGLPAVFAGPTVVFQFREVLGRALADVGAAGLDQLAGVFVVDRKPVACPDHLVGLEPEVGNRVEDRVVGLQVRPLGFRVRVVEPTEHPAVVLLLVGADNCRHAGASQVPRTIGVGCEAHPDLLVGVGVRKRRQ